VLDLVEIVRKAQVAQCIPLFSQNIIRVKIFQTLLHQHASLWIKTSDEMLLNKIWNYYSFDSQARPPNGVSPLKGKFFLSSPLLQVDR
jgi:hypothetical protein